MQEESKREGFMLTEAQTHESGASVWGSITDSVRLAIRSDFALTGTFGNGQRTFWL